MRRRSGPDTDSHQRIAKLLAQRGVCSRREAERLIGAGQVLLEGAVVREQGVKAPYDARIEIAERGQGWLQDRLTLLMHKPRGIVSTQAEGSQVPAWKLLTAERAHGPIAGDLLHRICEQPFYFNVAGRLDRDSRGLLILTQDGTLARRVTGGGTRKGYLVTVDRPVPREALQRLQGRMSLDGRQLRPMRVEVVDRHRLRFELREGRKHQIRRVCQQVGLQVTDLLRERVGSWELGELPEGCWCLASGS